MLTKKIQLHQLCLTEIQERIDQISSAIEEIQEAANEETKSSSGDKFETGRAMMQQEKDKLEEQLASNLDRRNQLKQLKPDEKLNVVQLGSLVETNEGKYYFSIALGKMKLGEDVYYAISTISPLGQALLGKKAGDKIIFQNREISILGIS